MVTQEEIHVLLVADDPTDVMRCQEALRGGSSTFHMIAVEQFAQAVELLRERPFDVVLLDQGVTDGRGLDALSGIRSISPDVPVVVITSTNEAGLGVRAMQKGAQDYLVKTELRSGMLIRAIRYAIERGRNQADLRHSEARLQVLVDEAQDYAIFTLDSEGRVATWNKGARRIKGYLADEIIRQPYAIFFAKEDVEQGKPAKMLQAAAQDGMVRDEGWRVRRDGSRFWAEVVLTALKNGKQSGFSKITRDLTERRRMEQEVRDAGRRKDEFLATLAHEMRNPLAPIRNAVQCLGKDGLREPGVKAAKDVIGRQVAIMARLIDDLLDLSRINSNKLDIRKERVELAAVVESAVESSGPLIEQCGLQLTVNLPQAPIHLDADPVRLAQVLLNLLNNAAKYTRRGGHIWLSAEQQGSDAVVSVRDDGIGIPADMLARIFEMFTQVDQSIERSQGGLGIGLTLVRRLVEMHDGNIEAYSNGPNEGSEFVIRLPVFNQPSPKTPPHGDMPRATVMSDCRILVVDDNKDSADSLGMLLQLDGNDIRIAHDGLEALEMAEAFQPEFVLLDIGLPKLNGFEVARRIRQQPWGWNAVIIALTGPGEDEDRRRSQEAGFNFHLVKPVDLAALEKLLAGLQATTQ